MEGPDRQPRQERQGQVGPQAMPAENTLPPHYIFLLIANNNNHCLLSFF